MKYNIIISFIVIALSGNNLYGQNDSLIDKRDNHMYKTVQIGDQIWMAENLDYKTDNSYCYGNKEENCKQYGRLYRFEAALKACPAGWHLPTDKEWQQLEKSLGMPEEELGKINKWRGTDQGEKLLLDSITGFNLPLGGYHNPPYNNYLMGIQAFIWTASENGYIAYYRQFMKDNPKIFRRARPKSWSMSVRCVKDNE